MQRSTIRTDIAELKQDVGELKQDIGQLKQDVGQLKEDSKQKGEELEFIREYLATEVLTRKDKDEIIDQINQSKNEIFSYIDAFMKKTTKVEDEQLVQGYRIRENTDTLERHDKEIKNIQFAIAV